MSNSKAQRAEPAKTPAAIAEISIDNLTSDPRNANKGTDRGAQALEKSLKRYGAGRSILLDRNGVVIAGNKTVAAARAAGIERIVVVPSDGKTIVAVQREDLDLATDKNAQGLAIADNRVGELSLEWDGVVLAELEREGVELGDLFTKDEISKLVEFEANEALPEEFSNCPTCGQRMRE